MNFKGGLFMSKLTASVSVRIDDKIVPFESMTESQKNTLKENIQRRLELSESLYYTQNIQEFKKI